MRKTFLTVAAIAAGILGANAQETLSYSKFFDNWQVGVKGGGFSDTHRENFFGNTRATFGAELSKQLTPVFRLGVEGMAYVRPAYTTTEPTYVMAPNDGNALMGNFVDYTNVSLVGTVNLGNLFLGYKGAPRKFEVEGFAGLGWYHEYPQGADNRKAPIVLNGMTSQFGSNLLFNLGQSKAWGIKISPALIYFVDGVENRAESNSQNELNLKNSWTQVTAGVVYRFKGSNGAHHFTTATQNPDNSAELGRLRDELNSKNKELSDCQRQVNKLQDDLEAARNKKPEVVEKVVTKNKKTLESVVTFRVAKSTIDASQLPNVERIASYLNKYSNAKVSIKGYASPEGNLEKNKQLATARAEAVKNLLVKRYKISADRIQAEGNGIGDMFSEPDWNRVSIANIVE